MHRLYFNCEIRTGKKTGTIDHNYVTFYRGKYKIHGFPPAELTALLSMATPGSAATNKPSTSKLPN